MYDRLIVASGNRDLRRFWKEMGPALGAILLPSAAVEACKDAEHVRQILRLTIQGRDLLIVDLALPGSDDSEPLLHGALSAGFALVHELQAKMPAPACILVGPGDNRIAAASGEWPLFGMLANNVPEQLDMVEDFKRLAAGLASKRDKLGQQAAGSAHQKAPASPVTHQDKPWALLDISLHRQQGSCFTLQIGNGTRLENKEDFPFELNRDHLQEVILSSRALRKKISECLHDKQAWSNYVSQWRKDYEALGRRVFTLINRDEFGWCWGRAWEAAQENARLRFILDGDAYDVLWESMFDPFHKWLMLKSTIIRRAQVVPSAPTHRLDGGDGVLHMLAIASDVPDESRPVGPDNMGWRNFWNGYYGPIRDRFYRANGRTPRLNEVLKPLPELGQEMDELKRLEHETVRLNTEKLLTARLDVEILRSQGAVDGKLLFERVEEALSKCQRRAGGRQFDVVHFAGHAIFNDDGRPHDRGYLVFGDEPHTRMVPVSEFAALLHDAGVQMAYLSCCRSSAARAAFELADAGIPLAIGFTWDLDSALAVEFARAFYGALLENNLKVCKAFQRARRKLSSVYGEDDPIWTSPVLVAQPTDWLSAEGCLAVP